MNTPENKAKAEIKKYLDTLKPELFYYSQPAGPHSSAGIADIICCYRGLFFAIEVKSEERFELKNNSMSPSQVNFMNKVKEAGGLSICVCSAEEVRMWINHLRGVSLLSELTVLSPVSVPLPSSGRVL